MSFWRVSNRWRRSFRRPNQPLILLGVTIALTLIIMVRAYSDAQVGSPARAVITTDASQAQIAVATHAPVIDYGPPVELLVETVIDESTGEEGGAVDAPVPDYSWQLGQMTCGTVTNNTAHRIWDIVVIPSDGHGKVDVARTSLYPGDSTDLLCDLTGLGPGEYFWDGDILLEWPSGRARVPFAVEFFVPEPPPLPEQLPAQEVEGEEAPAEDDVLNEQLEPEQDTVDESQLQPLAPQQQEDEQDDQPADDSQTEEGGSEPVAGETVDEPGPGSNGEDEAAGSGDDAGDSGDQGESP